MSVHGRPIAVAVHQPVQVVDAGDRLAVDGEDQVLRRAGPARAAGESGITSTTSTARSRPDGGAHARRQRARAGGDADPGAPHPAVAHQLGDDLAAWWR